MLITCRRGLAAGAVVCILIAGIFTSRPAVGQFSGSYAPDRISRGAAINLFASWNGNSGIDGFLVTMPQGWKLESAAVLKNAFRSLPHSLRPLDDGRYEVRLETALETPAELVLGVKSSNSLGSERVEVTPFVATSGRRQLLEPDQLFFTVHEEPEHVDPENRVLSFAASEARPLVFRRTAVPSLDLERGFAVSLWLKSTDLNQVIASTWDGDENHGYPIELVIDAAGRLRCFRGRPGEHQSMGSKLPIADGVWHRILVTNRPDAGWMRLQVDGRTVDSLYSASPLRISMDLPLAVGGRVPAKNAYFDGMKPFSGYIDAVHVAPVGPRGGSRNEQLELDLDNHLPEDLLSEPARGVRLIRSDLSFRRPIDHFRANAEGGSVTLRWRARDFQSKEFVVERSRDGRVFDIVHRAPALDRAGEYEYRDTDAGEGVAFYRLRQIFAGGAERVSSTIKVGMGEEQPERITLVGNFPNPFNNLTTISYVVKEQTHVRLSVWDLSGQSISQLVDRVQTPGFYDVQFDAGDLPSGTYFVRLQGPGGTKSHKMILMK